jgi:hypothetical protein
MPDKIRYPMNLDADEFNMDYQLAWLWLRQLKERVDTLEARVEQLEKALKVVDEVVDEHE